jgi:DNA-binding transcriptional ArsR family regulator
MVKEQKKEQKKANSDFKSKFVASTADFRKTALILRAVNHELRQEIILYVHQKERVNVKEIYRKLGIEQSVASQHLAILRKSNLLLAERSSQNNFYTVNYKYMQMLQDVCGKLLNK